MADDNNPPGTPERSPGNSPRFPPGFLVAASPPRFVSFEQLMSSADDVTNMALAHEIAVDQDFKLEKVQPPESSVEKQVRDVMHKAFWDSLQEKLSQDPPDYSHALVLMEEVKELLLSLTLPQHHRLQAQINEVFDMDLIQQKVANDAFDIQYYGGFVISLMERLCAPARDAQISQLKSITEIVPLYKAIFEVIDLMKMDMANFTIQQIRPYIQLQSVEYEKKKFQSFLDTQTSAGQDGLNFTKAWLQFAADKMKEEKTPIKILNEAFLLLLDWTVIFPETILMDQERFLTLQRKTKIMIWVSSALLVIHNIVGEPMSGIATLKDRLKTEMVAILEGAERNDLVSAMAGVYEKVKDTLTVCLLQNDYPALSKQQQEALKTQLPGVVNSENAVFQVIKKRVFTFLREMMSWKTNTPQMQIPPGLGSFSQELSNISGQFLRLISHNRAVFGTHYAGIIGSMLSGGELSPRGVADQGEPSGS